MDHIEKEIKVADVLPGNYLSEKKFRSRRKRRYGDGWKSLKDIGRGFGNTGRNCRWVSLRRSCRFQM